jgi:3D (Asp-Asp-Asp) domain-containing protein
MLRKICLLMVILLLTSPHQAEAKKKWKYHRVYPVVSRGGALHTKVQATGYTWTGDKTSSGHWPKRGSIAVDPKVIPIGSVIWIDGYGFGVAMDKGAAIQGGIIDLYFDTEKEAIEWGRRTVRIVFIKPPKKIK